MLGNLDLKTSVPPQTVDPKGSSRVASQPPFRLRVPVPQPDEKLVRMTILLGSLNLDPKLGLAF